MNFQTSKRIMCCLLAALILCCAVVRPLEASASALATGAIVGYALEPAISAILIALGVTGTLAAFTELVKNVARAMPSDYIVTGIDGEKYLNAVNYNETTYVAQEVVEAAQNVIFGSNESVAASFGLEYEGVPFIPGTEDVYEQFKRTNFPGFCDPVYSSAAERYKSLKRCYVVELVGHSQYKGFYLFTNSEPIIEECTILGKPGIEVDWPENSWYFCVSTTSHTSGGYSPNGTLFQGVTDYTIYEDYGVATAVTVDTAIEGISHTDVFHATVPDYETWVFPGIHIIILPEDPEPEEPPETEPPETEPPEFQPAVPPTPSEPTPSEPEPEVTDPVELPDTDPSTPSEPETPEEDEPVVDPNKYETYIPVKFPNEILDPNEVTQPEIQTGNGSERPEIETGNTVEIEDPHRTETEEPTNPDDDTEWGDPVVWPDFPHVDTPEVPFPGTDNDYTGNENDTSWLTKIGEWIKWLGEIVQFLPDAIAALLKLMVQWLVDAFKPLFQKLAEWLQPLMDYLLEGLTKLFVPKDGYFDSKINELRSQFSLFDSILALLYDLKAFLVSLGSAPPVIYIPLSSATGEWYWGSRMVFVDFSWYAPYKSTMDNILSGLLWLWFAWRIVLSLPGIMQGISGAWKSAHVTYTKTGG